MLTEVDTRDMAGQSVSLFMDTDTQVYLVCVEGYEPITCLTRERALMAYKHPWVYMPLQASVSPSNAMEGGRRGTETVQTLEGRTSALLVELKDVLALLDDSQVDWFCGIVGEIVRTDAMYRHGKPYDHGEEDLPFV